MAEQFYQENQRLCRTLGKLDLVFKNINFGRLRARTLEDTKKCQKKYIAKKILGVRRYRGSLVRSTAHRSNIELYLQ